MGNGGGIMQLISNDGAQDRFLLPTGMLNTRLLDIEKFKQAKINVTACNTIMLLNYKDTILAQLPPEIAVMICKTLLPRYNPKGILNYIQEKMDRAQCFNALMLSIQRNNYVKPPTDVKKLIFEYYLTEDDFTIEIFGFHSN